MAKLGVRYLALAYLFVLLLLPLAMLVRETFFTRGLDVVLRSLTSPTAVSAFHLTLVVTLLAVLANTIFGVGVSLLLVRHRFPGRRLLDALIDLPIAVSPVVVGLALILVYGRFTPLGGALESVGLQVIFSVPGMVLATAFVTLPLVVREVVPVLQEIGTEAEQAASTLGASALQTFRRVTLPAIRWALAYGVVLTFARALGEYGAVAVVSGRIVGKTQTVTLLVEQRFENFDQVGAYSAALALAAVAVLTMVAIDIFKPKELEP